MFGMWFFGMKPRSRGAGTQGRSRFWQATAGKNPVMKARFDGTVLADSDTTAVVEGNHYFPPAAVHWEHLRPSETTSRCPWKGKADWFHLRTDDAALDDGAWTYRRPWLFARRIRNHVAFGPDVEVIP